MGLLGKLFRRTPSVVAIGGGTGLSTLLGGLKEHTDKILAVCTVGDDGGSSGRLRKDFDILPPGDIRNCLVALSDSHELLGRLFQYRFEESDLKGHNFGNIFLAALTRVTGDFYTAVKEANHVLNVRGEVLPATLTKIALIAHHADGSKSTGESLIGAGTGKRIERISLKPEPDPASPEIVEKIEAADLIILGPGSIYTSIIPNLLIKEILPAITRSHAIVCYVCNVMTQPGESSNYSASDHVEALMRHATPGLLDFVVVNNGVIPANMLLKYQGQDATPVEVDLDRLKALGGKFRLVQADLVNAQDVVRHDAAKLSRAILQTYRDIVKENAKQKTSA